MGSVGCAAIRLFCVAAAGFGGHGAWVFWGGREVEGMGVERFMVLGRLAVVYCFAVVVCFNIFLQL